MFYLPGRIPVRISGGFWLVAALIGYIQSFQLMGTLTWMVIIVLSVLFHEMGHAYVSKIFHQRPSIALVPFGGVTSFQGKNLSSGKQFLVVLNGPLFGFLLFLSTYLLRKSGVVTNLFLDQFFLRMQVVNLFWSIINLIPVLPMDGGQLLRIVLEAAFGIRGFRAAIFISMALAGMVAFGAFAVRQYLIGAILFLFAYQSFEMWRNSKNITKRDRDRKLAGLLEAGENYLKQKQIPQAEETFQLLRSKAMKGLLYIAATQYLALIEREKGDSHLAYELLLAIKDDITPDAVYLLQELAFFEENYQLVVELAVRAYEQHPSQMVALRNARAYGFLMDAKSAGGWLQTALEYGNVDREEILAEDCFSQVRHDPEFTQFFPEH